MSRREHQRARVRGAVFALLAYAYAFVAAPLLHAQHHALHGSDHTHDAAGQHALSAAPEEALDPNAVHADFDAVLASLGLADAASAGALAVDCSLSAYTLTDCAHETRHEPGFGDALVAHHHHAPRPDAQHGAGSIEHLSVALLSPTVIWLPPPSLTLVTLCTLPLEAQGSVTSRRTHAPRGPPSTLVV